VSPRRKGKRRGRAGVLVRALDVLLGGLAEAAYRVLPALPSRLVLRLADALAAAVCLLDRRGSRVARENLRAAFGDEMSPRERRRTVRASYRNAVRTMFLLGHLRPLTGARRRRWLEVDRDVEARLLGAACGAAPPVFVSAHFGNWELGLAALSTLPCSIAYLTETSGLPRVDAVLDRMRERESGRGARRKGGGVAMLRAMKDGVAVAFLVDRNVRRRHGGRWVPFLGLPARTTPLAATLAERYGAPLHVLFCLPRRDGGYRLWMSPDLRGARTGDDAADVLADTARVNDVLSRVIREEPGAWMWTTKRWKDRPTPELGRYPPYSRYDPDA
jgi:KDO2-lipid IV(A) lauroyltransferase